jgi:hypothetical protein
VVNILVIEYWNLGFICNLMLGYWNLNGLESDIWEFADKLALNI